MLSSDIINTSRSVLIVILLVLFAFVSSCGSEEDEFVPNNNELYEPSEDEWNVILSTFIRNRGLPPKLSHFVDTINWEIDFLKKHKSWFAIIVSIRDSQQGFFYPVIGYHSKQKNRIVYRDIKGLNYYLTNEELDDYLRKIGDDSLWAIFGKSNFWDIELEWVNIFTSNSESKNPPLDEISSTYSINLFLDRSNQIAELNNNNNLYRIRNLLMDSLTSIISNSDKFNEESLRFEVLRKEYFLKNKNWFLLIVSKRNDSICIYSTVTAHIDYRTSILKYKFIENTINTLYGKENVNHYLSLLQSDNLWEYFTQREVWYSENNIKLLFNQSLNSLDSIKYSNQK